MEFGEIDGSLLRFKVLYCVYQRFQGEQTMTVLNRSAEYRYDGFTYFMGKAYVGLAESRRV